MIVCFSGTGNSRHIADMLHQQLGDVIIRLAPGQMLRPERVTLTVTDQRVIWVGPVHGWGLPSRVVKVINKCNFANAEHAKHYLVLTCGDDIGYTDRQWRRLMHSRGFETVGAYSVQMPNSYTFLPGFDVDPQPVVQAKLDACVATTQKIAQGILDCKPVADVVRGSYPWFKSAVLYPLFQTFICRAKKYHATDACSGCGKCMRNCSTGNISMVDGKPKWGNNCNFCLRCYHCCPKHAVAFGKHTENKGQYLCPGYKLN